MSRDSPIAGHLLASAEGCDSLGSGTNQTSVPETIMELSLQSEEAILLKQVLERFLSNLRMEIADTRATTCARS